MKIGLAVSGGGMRSMAHLGMMKALEEHGVNFDVVSGASAGAAAGALYCAGYSPEEVLQIVSETNFLKLVKPALSWRGLLRIDSVEAELKNHLPENSFEALKKPLIIAATNLAGGKVKYFKKGELIRPILASCSIPVVFDPVEINGVPYIDGGIMDNMPVKPLRKKCNFIIGMHSNPIEKNPDIGNWKELMERSLLMAISNNSYNNIRHCDLFWEPPVGRYNVFDFKKAREIFEIGYEYGCKQLETKPLSITLNRAS